MGLTFAHYRMLVFLLISVLLGTLGLTLCISNPPSTAELLTVGLGVLGTVLLLLVLQSVPIITVPMTPTLQPKLSSSTEPQKVWGVSQDFSHLCWTGNSALPPYTVTNHGILWGTRNIALSGLKRAQLGSPSSGIQTTRKTN